MKKIIITVLIVSAIQLLHAQSSNSISIKNDASKQKVTINIGGKLFTEFCYPDSLEKPFLYPIIASNGTTITRGFPLAPRANDATDHPHHIGLWMNYESVNGLDFWNNSYAITPENKVKYGWIRTRKITETRSGKDGLLSYEADWHNQSKQVLMQEKTSFHISVAKNQRIIDRITVFTAVENVQFADVKDGFLGLRVAHELELPIAVTKQYKDDKGIVTTVKANKDSTTTGNYITSMGASGDKAWGTRGTWCMLYGKMGKDTISIAIIDHPQNPGYPTYWHARNYGLFAANPLGQKVFSNGKETLNLKLEKGKSISFKYRIIIAADNSRLSEKEIAASMQAFQEIK
jgi:hypothetical protein